MSLPEKNRRTHLCGVLAVAKLRDDDMDDYDMTQDELVALAINNAEALYGLARPEPRRRWIATIAPNGVGLAYLVTCDLEIEIAFSRGWRSASQDLDVVARDVRRAVARGLMLKVSYPVGGAPERDRGWWDGLVRKSHEDGRILAADSEKWYQETMHIDGSGVRGWCTEVRDWWAFYCEHDDGHLFVTAHGSGRGRIEVRSVSESELGEFEAPPEDLDDVAP
jgi:hypothetical protein